MSYKAGKNTFRKCEEMSPKTILNDCKKVGLLGSKKNKNYSRLLHTAVCISGLPGGHNVLLHRDGSNREPICISPAVIASSLLAGCEAVH